MRGVRWLALLVTLLAFALRLWRVERLGDLEFDEIVSVRYASLDAGELIASLSRALFEHPPLYYLILGGWLALSGALPATEQGDLLARLLSVFPGTLLVPLTYAAGVRLTGSKAGFVAAALVAAAPLPLFYSREARMYELVACLGLAGTWLFLRAAHRGSPSRWLAFAIVGAATALVHYSGLLLVIALPFSMLTRPRQESTRPALLAVGAVALAATGWILGASGVRGSLPALDAGHLVGAPAAVWHVIRELAGGPESGGTRTILAGLALLALVGLGAWRGGRDTVPMVVGCAAGVFAVVFAVVLGKPVQARYALAGVPFMYLLAGTAIAHRAPTARGLAAGMLVLGTLPWAVTYYGSYKRADYGDITRRIATHERAGDAILLTGPWQAWYFDYYYPRTGGTILHHVLPRNAPPALDPDRAAVELAELQAGHRRVWLVQAGLAQADPTGFVERWLGRSAWPALREAQQTAVLSLYALHAPEERRPLHSVELGETVRLIGGWVEGEDVPAAEVVRLSLELELLRETSAPLRASVRLVGADGQRLTTDFDLIDVAREGRPINQWQLGERVTLRRGVWVPVSANPQPYDVRMVLYDGATLTPLEPSAGATGSGGEVSIGAVFITQTRAQQPPPEGEYERVDRTFGGGDDFDALSLVGVRWHQRDSMVAPLKFDLLWRVDGTTGALHRTRLTVRDADGRVWMDTIEPLFSGSFPIHDWRPSETLGERRVLDLTALPDGDFRVGMRLLDGRGRQVPVAGVGAPDEVELTRVVRPRRHSPNDWLTEQVGRVTRRVAPLLSYLS